MARGHAHLHRAVEPRLRRARQRYTEGRRTIVEVLADAGRPLAIGEVLEARDGLAQSSTYRNLHVLEQAGTVRRVIGPADAGARYELAEELTEHHHHLLCRACGAVEDFQPSAAVERALDEASREAGTGGFAADHHRLDLVGICAACG